MEEEKEEDPIQPTPERLCKHKGSCVNNALRGLVTGFLQGFGIKAAIHLVLNFLVKRKFRDPIGVIKELISIDALRISGFLSLLKFIYKAVLCSMRNIRGKEDGLNSMVAGGLSGLALIVEDETRKENWSLYFFGRMIDIVLRILEKRGYPVNVHLVETIMFMGMSVFMLYCYGVEPDNMMKSYYNFLDMFFNPSPNELKIITKWREQSKLSHPLK